MLPFLCHSLSFFVYSKYHNVCHLVCMYGYPTTSYRVPRGTAEESCSSAPQAAVKRPLSELLLRLLVQLSSPCQVGSSEVRLVENSRSREGMGLFEQYPQELV